MNPRAWTVTLCVALGACVAPTEYRSTPAYSVYTLEEVVRWSKAGEDPQRIVARLDAAHSFYPLTAGEVVRLHEQGVATPVLDYLLDSYVRRVRREERFSMPRGAER